MSEELLRLPDGAEFLVVYSAEAEAWGGTLRLMDGTVFMVEKCSEVFMLMKILNRLYRESLD